MSLRFRLLDADRLARTLASACIGRGALTANGQAAAMANAAVAVDRLEALEVALNFAAKITFNRQFAGGDRVDQLTHLLGAEVLGANIRINIGLFEDAFSSRRPDPVDIRKGGFDALVAGNFNT